jgi:ABC-type transport system involved in cytochrome bd biosynthesis fused ATPase/permease subunit
MFHKRLMKEFKEKWKLVCRMVTVKWVMLLANMLLTFVLSGFAAAVFENSLTKKAVIEVLVCLILVIAVRGVMSWEDSRLSFQVSTEVKRKLREMIYNKLMRLGTSYSESVSTAEAVQISTEGVEQLEIYFGKYVPQFFYSILAPVTLFIAVGRMNMKAAVILFLCVPLIPLSIVMVQKFAKKMLGRYWGTYTELGDSFLEGLLGLTTLKIYQADGQYAKKMDEESEKFRKVTMKVLIMQLNSISIMDLVAYGGTAAGIVISILELQKGAVSFAECFFIIMISSEFFLPLRLLGSFFHIAMNGNAAADKIFHLLDVKEKKDGEIRNINGNDIRFENVSFGYQEDIPVLNHLSFEAGLGMTALVGESGCGKSTVTSLIMGKYSVKKGKIEIGRTDIRDIHSAAVYKKITRIGHESYIFQGSVRDNLKMGKESASEDEMFEALKKVDLQEWVKQNGGLNMEITEKGANLSGGQRQRLALARAILYDSDIYIFDEATSNIDVESENQIMKAVRDLSQRKTVILISHRLANVKKADKIYVMKSGRIEEAGIHRDLMEKGGYYKNLYENQKLLENYGREVSV